MLEDQGYGESLDIWSAGCIFAELLQGKVLFPGQNDIQQFHMITELLGKPSEHVTKMITSRNVCLCFISFAAMSLRDVHGLSVASDISE
jgi:serine/threonine protein kinase